MSIRLIPRRLIGQTIHGIRTRLGMSPAEFAKSLGLEDAREVGKWERGTVQPDYGTLAKIATMGVVDVLVFHEAPAVDGRPQLTPGEAAELGGILARMEALLAEARRLVDRASNRTAVELLDAATGSSSASLAAGDGLVLDASVRVEAKPRTRARTATAGRTSEASGTRTGGGRTGGSSTTRSSNSGSSSGSTSGGAKSTSRKASGTSGSVTRTGGSRSTSSRAGGGSSRASTATRASGGSSDGGSASGGSSSGDSTTSGSAGGSPRGAS